MKKIILLVAVFLTSQFVFADALPALYKTTIIEGPITNNAPVEHLVKEDLVRHKHHCKGFPLKLVKYIITGTRYGRMYGEYIHYIDVFYRCQVDEGLQ